MKIYSTSPKAVSASPGVLQLKVPDTLFKLEFSVARASEDIIRLPVAAAGFVLVQPLGILARVSVLKLYVPVLGVLNVVKFAFEKVCT